jgi:sugar-specific transcriptional regulator TrmB
MLKDELIKFGLSQTEADVYILVAQQANIKAGEIIKELNLHRPLVYRALESLVKNNMISEFQNKIGKSYSINDPVFFQSKANEKLVLAQNIESQIKSLNSQIQTQNEVILFRGQQAILDFINLVIETKKTWYVIGAVFGMRQPEFEIHIPHFKEKFSKLKIKSKVIAKFGSQNFSWTPEELTKTKILPKDFTNSPIVVHIFGDYVCHTIWEKPETVIIIKNRAIATEYIKYFELLWMKSKIV